MNTQYRRSMITIYFDDAEQEAKAMKMIEELNLDHDGIDVVPEVDEDGNVVE